MSEKEVSGKKGEEAGGVKGSPGNGDYTPRDRGDLKWVNIHSDLARSYFEVAGVMFVALDRDGCVVQINPKGCKILGYPEEEIVGENWFDKFTPEGIRGEAKDVFSNIMSGELESVEYLESPVLTKSGNERIIAWHNSVIVESDGVCMATLSSGEDITKRKMAEEALKESEKNYQKLFNSVLDAIIIHEITDDELLGKIIDVNHMASIMLGYSRKELLKMETENINSPNSTLLKPSIVKRIVNGEKALFEHILRAKDGQDILVEAHSQVVYFKGRKVILSTVRDITERKKAQSELELLSQAVRQTTNSVLIADRDWITVFVNQKYLDNNGMNEEQVLGVSWGSLDTGLNEIKKYEKEIQKRVMVEKEPWTRVLRDTNGKGEIIWTQERISPILDNNGDVVNILYIGEDVTDEKATKLKLGESEEEYRNTFDYAAIGIARVSLDGSYLRINEKLCEMLAYERDELLGMKFSDYTHPDYKDESEKVFADLLNGMNDSVFFEKKYVRKDGRAITCNVTSRLLCDSNGKPLNFITIIEDITKRKETATLLKNTLKEKETLYAELQHRVKNNLQILSSIVSLRIMRAEDEMAARELRNIQGTLHTMATIFQKAYADTSLIGINVNRSTYELVKDIIRLKNKEGLFLSYNVEGDEIHLGITQALPLSLIINELVFNSIKHGFNGRERGNIRIIFIEKGDTGTVVVMDDGQGPEDELDFDSGMTLGLKLVKSLTDQLGGTIKTVEKDGLEVTVTFPIEEVK